MTATQISYYTYVEGKRHNLATERLTATDLEIKDRSLNETRRHNVATEGLTASQVAVQRERNAQDYEIGKGQLGVAKYNAKTNRGQLKVSQGELKVHKGQLGVSKGQLGVSKQQVKQKDRELDIKQQQNALTARQLDQNWKLLESQIGLNQANELLTLANRDLTQTKNKYAVYEILAKMGSAGKISGLLGMGASKVSENEFKKWATAVNAGEVQDGKFKPTKKFQQAVDTWLELLTKQKWVPQDKQKGPTSNKTNKSKTSKKK